MERSRFCSASTQSSLRRLRKLVFVCCAAPGTRTQSARHWPGTPSLREAVRPLFTMSNSPAQGCRWRGIRTRTTAFPSRCGLRVARPAPGLHLFIFSQPPEPLLCSPPPNRGAAERREAPALKYVALVGRDATLARHGPSRATGTPPLGAPPWRCRPRDRFRLRRCRRMRCEGSTPPDKHARPQPRASRIRGYEPRSTPHPLRRQDRLRRRPSMSE